MPKTRMSKKEYNENLNYYIFNLVALPFIIIIGIYMVSITIESLSDINLGVFKQIFAGIGGIGYFIYYFRVQLKSIIDKISK
jgi:hypothetical protein